MLIDQIREDLKNAQLARDEIKVSTLRLILSGLIYARVDSGSDLSDEDVLGVISKEAKKRRESIEAFRAAGRPELAQKEEAERKLLQFYLPEQMSTEELTNIVEATINEVGADSTEDMGKVIGIVMAKVKGRADGSQVSVLVKERLT